MSSPSEVLIVGSGASAVAAAWALLEKGVPVCMLDGGLELEPERQLAVNHLRDKPRDRWTPADLAAVKGTIVATSKGVEDKLVFGSGFVFRGMDRFHPIRQDGSKMYQTLAAGGLSNVWGGSMLPVTDSDLGAWPFGRDVLVPHYRQVLARLPFAAREDDIARTLPLYDARTQPSAPLSRQAAQLLGDLDAHRSELTRAGFTYGQSRLAMRTGGTTPESGCSACSLCMYGCPWNHIWSSAHELPALEQHPSFRRLTGLYVERFDETDARVTVHLRDLQDGARSSLAVEQVVLAAGVVSSTRIMLSTLEAFDRPVRIRHSEHFQFPLMRLKGVSGVTTEAMHTLSHIYLELNDAQVSPHAVHLQVYTYNDFFAQVMDGMLGPAARLMKGAASAVLGRLLLLQGYLHSDESSSVMATLAPGEDGELRLEGVPNKAAAASVDRVVAKLDDVWRALGAKSVPGMVAVSKPGSGNHSGGSFPMRATPGPFETDTAGRPHGFRRIRLADASVLPSVPATTITLTVMANAHRIGQELASDVINRVN